MNDEVAGLLKIRNRCEQMNLDFSLEQSRRASPVPINSLVIWISTSAGLRARSRDTIKMEIRLLEKRLLYLDPRCQWAPVAPDVRPTHSYLGRRELPSNSNGLSNNRERSPMAMPLFLGGAIRGNCTILLLAQSVGCSKCDR